MTDSGSIYWVSNSVNPSVAGANRNQTPFTGLAPGDYGTGSVGLAILGAYMYWITADPLVHIFGPGQDGPYTSLPVGMALDLAATPSLMLWTNPGAGTNGVIQALGGGILSLDTPVYAAHNPVAIAVDSTNVYWSEIGGVPGQGVIWKAPLPTSTGPGPGPVTAIASGQVIGYFSLGISGARTLAVNSTNAYFITLTNYFSGGPRLMQAPITGSTTTPLILATGSPVSVAADSTGVYWVDNVAGTVLKVAVGSTAISTLATNQAIQTVPGTIAVDGLAVYWGTDTSVMAVAK